MADYSLEELKRWNQRIEELVAGSGMDCYEQEFELVNFDEMAETEAYAGMPSRYPHWSFGKAYERIRTLNRYNLAGLPYEMVINSNPCIAYLMKDNSLLLQILTMAHVYGHNDFFKNNRLFRMGTRAELTVEMFKNHAARIREYISDPSIGYREVEQVINAAHALRFQCARTIGACRLDYEEIRKRRLESLEKSRDHFSRKGQGKQLFVIEEDMKQMPPEPEEDLLYFIGAYGRLCEWQKDIIDIIREETLYFIPQAETKIMNEGWACYWHYHLLNCLKLPQELHFEFLKRHNQVVRPYEGGINPYYLGFKIFEDLHTRNSGSMEKIFEVRGIERDESFIRRYLTAELCCELKLYEYKRDGNEYIVSEVADEEGWFKIRDTIAASAGLGRIPVIKVTDWNRKDNTILLQHIYDGRELEMRYAEETLKHMADLWEGRIMLNTVVEDRKRTILCDEQKKIVLINA